MNYQSSLSESKLCPIPPEVTSTCTIFNHDPVLLTEVVEILRQKQPRCIVDGTVGGGGHAAALLEALPNVHYIGLDRDPEAIAAAKQRLAPYQNRVYLRHARFGMLKTVLREEKISRIDALLLDLGVSSYQLGRGSRGFSFRLNGPLDMRMDPSQGKSAAELLSELDEVSITAALFAFGEERYAKRIAHAIVQNPPQTTLDLAQLVRQVTPSYMGRIDPATRTFMALRMLVNDELGELHQVLLDAPSLLCSDGLLLTISFHSLEDRTIKHSIQQAAQRCRCPKGLPVCACQTIPSLRLLTSKPIVASAQEVWRNPRARSAKLRVAKRLSRLHEC